MAYERAVLLVSPTTPFLAATKVSWDLSARSVFLPSVASNELAVLLQLSSGTQAPEPTYSVMVGGQWRQPK